jgi:DNA topoisomerase-3
MKTLVIAEKPSVGRDIARVLKCKQKGDGFLYNDDYVVSWAVGHLVTLKEPDEYNPSLKKWKMYDLPIIPNAMELKAIPKTESQLMVLKKLMNAKETGQIICATDSGREGELIFRYIYQWANCKKPVKRLWISSLTDTAITDGLANMKDGKDYDNLFASARCRAEADWLVGMNATRAFTIRYGSFGNSLPMGRVQTPSLAILVSRHHEIVAFEAKDYWEVQATFLAQSSQEHYKGIWLNNEGEERTYNQEQANEVAEKVKDQQGIIESIETEEKRQLPPQLFDLTELQRECNRKLGLSAQDTLTIAQALYEKHKVITYPRTDSRYLSKDMIPKLKPTVQAINAPPYDAFAEYILALESMPINKRIVDDSKVTDHHAIIPTGKKSDGIKPPRGGCIR